MPAYFFEARNFAAMNLFTRCLFVAALLLTTLNPASARKKYLAPHASAKVIDSLYLFQPLTSVARISAGNTAVYNDTLSRIGSKIQADVIRYYGDRMKLAGVIDISDTALKRRVAMEIVMLLIRANQKEYFEDTVMHSVIDSIMDASGKRFALISLSSGFVRTEANYKQQKKQNIRNCQIQAVAGMVGFRVIYAPPAAELMSSSISVMIIDAKENKTYYNDDRKDFMKDEYNPLNEESQRTEFKFLFDGFFWAKPNNERW